MKNQGKMIPPRAASLPEGFSIDRLENDLTREDFVWVEFPRTDNRPSGSVVEKLGDVREPSLLRALLRHGADFSAVESASVVVATLLKMLPTKAGELTEAIGWRGISPKRFFVLPDGIVGAPDHRVVLLEQSKLRCLAGLVSGDLHSWRTNVADLAVKSPAAAMALLMSLAGPLLPLSPVREGFILNFAGNSSSGKSTAVEAAASLWGSPRRIGTWNATDRAIFERAASNSCLCLILDDAEKAAIKDTDRLRRVHELTHALTSGSSREYSKVVSGQDQLPPLSFSCLTLSSSPRSIESEIARTDGDRVRFLELLVSDGSEGGIWIPATGGPPPENTARLTESLAASAATNYGAAGREWLRYLVGNQKSVPARLQKLIEKFVETIGAAGGVERRIAMKIGLLYAAGRLAKKAKVIGWKRSTILEVCEFAYRSITRSAFAARFDVGRVVIALKEAMGDTALYPVLKGKTVGQLKAPKEEWDGGVSLSLKRSFIRLSALRRLVEQQGGDAQTNLNLLLDRLRKVGGLLPGHNKGPTQDVRLSGSKVKLLVFDHPRLEAFWEDVAEHKPALGTSKVISPPLPQRSTKTLPQSLHANRKQHPGRVPLKGSASLRKRPGGAIDRNVRRASLGTTEGTAALRQQLSAARR